MLFCKENSGEERTGLASRLWLDPCASASFIRATFYLRFNVFPAWLTHPRWTGNQSTVGLCCWKSISDVLGKFPKAFLTLPPPPPASSVNCQNITLASDSKGVDVASHLTQLIVVSGSCRQAQDTVMWRAARTSPTHGKPYTVQRQGTLGGSKHCCPTLPQISSSILSLQAWVLQKLWHPQRDWGMGAALSGS